MKAKARKRRKARQQVETALRPHTKRSGLWSSMKGQIIIPGRATLPPTKTGDSNA